ncbi:uncharacterized protein LOC129379304 [Poeciliopsis prolifica]|uniref:uncharacterized protein LOC129379304 n=1 Tax=Poeciliopsis prolifica TaxID=188132 RepID=UPI002413E2EB|nr:uncharacterized protein LOC129379304 [Poeciliopsis prolifica]
MSRLNFNIFIFNLFFLSPEFVFGYDFKVIQPKSVSVQHVNQEQTASISCEHDKGHGYKLLDVRLYRISQNGKPEMLCQKGEPSCKDVNLTLSSTKFVFTLRNIKPEAIRATYQCEITMGYGSVNYTRRGINTTLLYDFHVIQPEVQHVNPDQTASISCEHDSYGSKLQDVRLYRISQNDKPEMLCQKGEPSCKDVNLTLSSTKFVFTLRNIKPEAIRATYQCEITMEYGGADYTRNGINTTLLYDFHVIQPEVQHVNPDQTASISCEPKAEGSTIQIARLYRISQDNSEHMVDQKSITDSCSTVITHQCDQSKVVFILQEVGPEEMKFTYQCEKIVKKKDVVYIERGKLKKLQERKEDCPSLDRSALGWILIGLLVLMFLYSCVITCLYFRLKATVWKNTKENCTYVVMKPPTQKRQHEDIYQMMQS